MTNAEKVVAIAENTAKICESLNEKRVFANGETIRVNDVTSITHPVTVKLSGSDFSNVTLTKYGKNLLDNNKTKANNGTLIIDGNRQSYYRDDLNDGTARGDLTTVLGNYQDFVGKTLIISYDFIDYKGTYSSFSTILRTDYSSNALTLDNGKQATFAKSFGTGKAVASYTIPKDDTAKELILRQYVGYMMRNVGDYIIIENLQVEIGDTVTEWEDYKEPVTYTPREDGTVYGLQSISPTMTLFANAEGVSIEAGYFPAGTEALLEGVKEITEELKAASNII